jgi:chemotaxis signal transduction protein
VEELKTRDGITQDVKQLISFTIGAEEYGLDLLRVKEVIRMRQITWLPKAPSCVKGIINLGRFITGVGKMDEKLIITIDVDRILSADEMSQIADSLEAPENEPALSGV